MVETTDNQPAAKAPKPWKASSAAKGARAAAQGIVNLVLVIWAVRDIRRRSDDEINGRRKMWMMAAFAPPVGPIAYFLFGRKRHAPDSVELS
jgi:hypothetical protein